MTSLIVNTVYDTTHAAIPSNVKVPREVWGVFKVINKVHRMWWWYRRAKIYTNPENFFKLAAGHSVNFLMGKNIVLRVAAQCVLIVTKILDCAEAHVDLYNACCQFRAVVRGRFSRGHSTNWSKESNRLFSPSTIFWWKSLVKRAAHFLKDFIINTFVIFKNIFKLSMVTIDTINSFSVSPETRNEAINEVFINATRWLNKLVDNQELLISKLTDYQEIIGKILKGIGSKITPEKLIKKVTSSLATTSQVYGVGRKVLNFANGLFKDIIKRGIFGFMQAIGLLDALPLSLVPPIDAPWMIQKSKNSFARGPEIWAITKPSMIIQSQRETLILNKLSSGWTRREKRL
jgi:hypothetical protein